MSGVLQALLEQRIVRILPLEFGQQHLYVLQLPGFLPVLNQQHPRTPIRRFPAQHGLQLFLRSLDLLQVMQSDGQAVAVVEVVRLQLDGA